MHFVGWMVAVVSIGVLVGREEGWAVGVLAMGSILLLLILRGSMASLRRPDPLSGPRSIDVEARHIRELQESVDEWAPSMKAEGQP